MDESLTYQSTQRYTIKNAVDSMSGQPLVQVTDSTGMIVAILNPTDFERNYVPVPAV